MAFMPPMVSLIYFTFLCPLQAQLIKMTSVCHCMSTTLQSASEACDYHMPKSFIHQSLLFWYLFQKAFRSTKTSAHIWHTYLNKSKFRNSSNSVEITIIHAPITINWSNTKNITSNHYESSNIKCPLTIGYSDRNKIEIQKIFSLMSQ